MNWTRDLSRGMSGEDVRYVKNILLQQGMLHAATHDMFGDDTRRAVRQFQMAEGLYPSGIVDAATWKLLAGMDATAAETMIDALVNAEEEPAEGGAKEEVASDAKEVTSNAEGVTSHAEGVISDAEEVASLPPAEAKGPSALALRMCTLALSRVGDIYVWGASGMTDLSDGAIQTKDSESARAIRLRNTQQKAGVTGLLAHDCSGFISYLMRQADVWTSRRDCDGIWGYCTPVQRDALIAGDFLFRHESSNPSNKTHIGLYIGRGLVVHSKGRDVGVVVEGINKGGSGYWHLCGRCRLLYK